MMQTYFPSKQEFLKLTRSGKGNLIPVYKEILGDLETPVSAYFKMAEQSRYSFLLESVEGEEKIARYSFLAKDPQLIFQSKGRKAEVLRFQDGHQTRETQEINRTPLDLIRDIMAKYKLIPISGLPRFCGGLVGYIGYDMVRFFEKLPSKPDDDLNLPDMLLILAKDLVIFDHRSHKIKVVSCVEFDPQSTDEDKLQKYECSSRRIDQLITELNRPLSRSL